jgi:hypothetical protein
VKNDRNKDDQELWSMGTPMENCDRNSVAGAALRRDRECGNRKIWILVRV